MRLLNASPTGLTSASFDWAFAPPKLIIPQNNHINNKLPSTYSMFANLNHPLAIPNYKIQTGGKEEKIPLRETLRRESSRGLDRREEKVEEEDE